MKIFFTFFFSVIACLVYAQDHFTINGVIGIEGGELYSYDMTIQSTSNPNEFKGTVKTYALVNKEVNAEVTVTIDRSAYTARLVETKILYNNGFQSASTICLVDAALTYDPANGVLKGPIITQTTGNGAYCAIGNVTFTSTSELQRLFQIKDTPDPFAATPAAPEKKEAAQPASPQYKAPEKAVVYQPQQQVAAGTDVPASTTIQEITQARDAELIWQTDRIILEIWDDNTIDGDRVTILYNGQEILSNYTLTASPKMLEMETGGSELNIITIVALNTGYSPPNSARIRLTDGAKEHDIIAHNDIGKKAVIRIKKKL